MAGKSDLMILKQTENNIYYVNMPISWAHFIQEKGAFARADFIFLIFAQIVDCGVC